MAFITRSQSAGVSKQGYPTALAVVETELAHARFLGNAATRRHSTHSKITWPEKYHEPYRLPSAIEQQPF
jgi:hypothetical protein